MFEYSFVPTGNGNRPMFMATASVGEAVLIAIAVITPMFFTDALPERGLLTAIFLPSVPLAPPPPAPVATVKRPVRERPTRAFDPSALVAPVVIPQEVAVIEEAPSIDPRMPEGGVPGGLPGIAAIGAAGLFGSNAIAIAPPPPPPPAQVAQSAAPPPPAATRQVKVGGDVQAAMLVKHIPPEYPLLARRSRITGDVILTAVIGINGSVKNLQVVSGHPMLVQATMKVVPQWVYKPTVLNGEAVEVITQIVVHFRLE